MGVRSAALTASGASLARPLLEFPAGWAGRPAFASGMGQITFAQMREGALRFCRLLRERYGVGPGSRVAFCLPKSLEAIQAIFGILASGAAYVPLQFQGPPSRLNSILRATEPRLLLTTAQMAGHLAADGTWPSPAVCCLAPGEGGQGLAPLVSGLEAERVIAATGADDLAAIYFTSGSTGEPKGVMLSHGNIAGGVDLIVKHDEMGGTDRLLSHTNLHYTAYDMFIPFALGCPTFLLSDREAIMPTSVAAALERERVTVWRSTVTALRLLLESGELAARDLRSLRLLGIFGEALPVPLLRQLVAALPACRLAFNYGATEAYRMSCFNLPANLPDGLSALPIGPGCEEYVFSLLNEEDREAEAGEIGEICVEGPLVMLGYWKDDVLTARRRLPGRPRSWRTGDLGYRDAGGLLHLVGRGDQMVKIRGHRFDLGEIETVLRRQPGVRDALAALIATGEGDGEVHAAVLAEASEALGTALRLACVTGLPAFARPSRIRMLRQFPTLSTGKVDRMALQTWLRQARDMPAP